MREVLAIAALVVGTVIGAGFASGREIVTFFGETPPIAAAVATAAFTFVTTATFLLVGRAAWSNGGTGGLGKSNARGEGGFCNCDLRGGARDSGAVNRLLAGRGEPILSAFTLFNSLVALAATLSGTDELFGEILPLKPLYSLFFGALSAVVAAKGIGGTMRVNAVVVPILIAATLAISLSAVSAPASAPFTGETVLSAASYSFMNGLLAASVLTTLCPSGVKRAIAAAAISAAAIGGLALAVGLALSSGAFGESDMPLIAMAKSLGTPFYALGIASVAAGIFTTMTSAHLSLTDWASSFCFSRGFAAVVAFGAAEIVAFIGFRAVVETFYPITGILGGAYFFACVIFLVRARKKSSGEWKYGGKVSRRGSV